MKGTALLCAAGFGYGIAFHIAKALLLPQMSYWEGMYVMLSSELILLMGWAIVRYAI